MIFLILILDKFGISSTSETKIISRSAYNGLLPNEIIYKAKTGWTVPVGFWLTNKMDKDLENFYTESLGQDALKVVTSSQKSAKMLIPDLTLKHWKEKYKVINAS